METELQSNIIESARNWVGVPYTHQGRSKRGIDCIGLILAVGHEVGLLNEHDLEWIHNEFKGYARLPNGQSLRNGFSQFSPEVPITQLQPSDVILVTMDKHPRHCAIYTDSDTIIHAYAERGKVAEARYAHY